MELRDYQTQAVKASLKFYNNKITRQLICLPTGVGKTVIFANILKEFNQKGLVLAHRLELIEQAKDKIQQWNPDSKVSIFGKEEIDDAQIVISTIQLASKPNHIQKLINYDPSILIIDEAHHAIASTYREVINSLGFNSKNKLLVGVTATSQRSDKSGLDKIFQAIIYEKNIPQMIGLGYLCELRGFIVRTGVDLSVAEKKNEILKNKNIISEDIQKELFDLDKLGKQINTKARNDLVLKTYQEKCADRKKTIIFCVDIQHAKKLANLFSENEIPSSHIDCKMKLEDRKKVLLDFKEGRIKVLSNFGILTEGFDEPEIDCVMVARPITSKLVYTQMVGRGTRIHPNKDHCLVIDFTDNTKHKLMTVQSLEERKLPGGNSPYPERKSYETVGNSTNEHYMCFKDEKGFLVYKPIDFNNLKTALEKDYWHRKPITEKQKALLKHNYPNQNFDHLTRKEASDLVGKCPATNYTREKLKAFGIEIDEKTTQEEACNILKNCKQVRKEEIEDTKRFYPGSLIDFESLTTDQIKALRANAPMTSTQIIRLKERNLFDEKLTRWEARKILNSFKDKAHRSGKFSIKSSYWE